VRRDWAAAREKVERESFCRHCGTPFDLDAAHIIPRSRVKPGPAEDALNIVPLCRAHHSLYDGGTLDLLPVLTRPEQAYAVELVGLEEARRYITNERAVA
jgi:5-methylcytosine-specific restriction endonuclease McrA